MPDHPWYEELFPFMFREKHDAERKKYREKEDKRINAELDVYESEKRNQSVPYFSKEHIQKLQNLIPLAMSEKGFCPLSEIKHFPELVSLNLLPHSNSNTNGRKSERTTEQVLYLLSERAHIPIPVSSNLPPHFKGNDDGDTERVREQWVDYLIIRSLQPLVERGIFEENDFNDSDVLDNHAYRYVYSKKEMVVHHADSNSRLALDDDD